MGAAVIGVIVIVFLIIFGLILLVAILYLLNLQNTLKAASPENRKMPPSNVWLLLIPIFNIYWQYVVVKNISATIEAEYASKGQVLDTPKPTYKLGMAMVVLTLINLVFSLFMMPETIASYSSISSGNIEAMSANAAAQSGNMGLSMLSSLVSFAGLILWIVYWVQTAGYKNKMKIMPDNKVESQIFGQM